MGLFRTAYDILGFKGLLCYLSIVLITWTLFRRINEYRRIIGSGGYCLEVKSSRFPLGKIYFRLLYHRWAWHRGPERTSITRHSHYSY